MVDALSHGRGRTRHAERLRGRSIISHKLLNTDVCELVRDFPSIFIRPLTGQMNNED